ncbi:MAG: uncharacterized protein PWQ91_392 [Eubacteriales bacterium]|nr:uncharacterized protein [Eubacteriales bacterium]
MGHHHHPIPPRPDRKEIEEAFAAAELVPQAQATLNSLEKGEKLPELIEINVVRFIHLLRHLGLRISSAELLDALRGLELVGLEDPQTVAAALAATLVKGQQEQKIFQRAFRVFFAPPEEREAREVRRQERKEIEEGYIREAEEDLIYRWYEPGPEGRSGEEKIDLTREEKIIYGKLPEEKKRRIKELLSKPIQRNPINNPRPVIEGLIRSTLNYWKHYLRQMDLLNAPVETSPTGDEEMDAMLAEIVEDLQGEEDLLYQDLQKIADEDLEKAGKIIDRLARQLAARISRRFRQSKKRKRLDMRRTIRQNISYGGSLYRLKFKVRRVEKPKIVLIADVSGSMAKCCRFTLQFIYGLATAIEGIEVFVFSDDLEHITCHFDQGCDFAATMSNVINQSKTWGKSTDLALALEKVLRHYRYLFDRRTYVIILSDTRTVAPEKAAKYLADLKRRVRSVIWLNTLPKREWREVKQVDLFRRYSKMCEANTLSQLERALRTQLRG